MKRNDYPGFIEWGKTAAIYFLTTILIHLFSLQAYTQTPTVQDCLGAIPVCQDIYVQETTYLGAGNYPNEIYNNPGNCVNDCPGSCLDGEQNSVWYVFTVQNSGMLRLTIDPFFDADDYDWAVYDISALRCTDIFSQYSLMQKSCNAWGSSTFNGNTGISTANGGMAHCNHCGDGSGTSKWNADLAVTQGRTYVLVIENWGTTPQGGYTLDFSASTASIYDNVRPSLQTVQSNEISCGDTEVIVDFSERVMCESVDPTDFIFTGPGGPYTVVDVQGQTCLLGGDMEKTYTLILDRAIGSDGDYAVQLTPLNFIYDACNNFALGNTVTFSVSLGAPVINTIGMNITTATCGLTNGSITGIQIAGSPPFAYLWTNESGFPVGTELELLNVPSGNYYLHVTDENTCETTGGPYFVDQTGAPLLDESALVITGANFGANNGHITGLQVSGNEPFTFQWTNETGVTVGNQIDLHDVYSGNYYLLATDEYGCDTLGGPYFVQQVGGPLGVYSTAFPADVCIGGSSMLSTTPFGGAGNYTFSWTSNPPGFSSELQSPVVFPSVTTIYTVVVSDGYVTASDAVTVNVEPLPVSDAGQDQTIPYGTSTSLFGSLSNGSGSYQYEWEPEDLLINPSAQVPATKNLYQTTLFRLRGTDLNTGCVSHFDTVVVNLDGGPLGVTLSAQDDTICRGESTVLTAYGFGGNYDDYTYRWVYNGEEVKVEQAPTSSYIATPAVSGDHIYQVEIFDGYNTFNSQIGLHVAPSPLFVISGGNQIVACPFDTVTLKPDNYFPGATYYWSNGSVEPEIKIGSTGIGFESRVYHLEVINQEGCSHSDSITVVFDFSVCTGISEDQEDLSVKIYPNPSTGIFILEMEDCSGFSFLQLFSINGSSLYRKNLDCKGKGKGTELIDLSGFPQGIFILKLLHENHVIYHKLVIE